MAPRALITVVAVVSSLIAPGVAQAVNSTVERSGGSVRVRAVNETTPLLSQNNITVSEDASGNLIVSDGNDSTGVVAGSGCSQLTPTTASCPPDPTNTTQLEVTSGVGDDVVGIDLPSRNNTGVATVLVNGGNEADTILGGGTVDTLEGDGLTGTGTPVGTDASAGNDTLIGRGERDTLRGGPLSDVLLGGDGTTAPDAANTLDGGPGSDWFELGGSLGADRVIGGSNDALTSPRLVFVAGTQRGARGDTVNYDSRVGTGSTGVTVDLDASPDDGQTGAAEGDQIDPDVESVIGTARDDSITGASAVNNLEGGLGVDRLVTGGGADTLRFRDGVRDRCYSAGSGVTIDIDLTDPTLDDCQISILPTTTKLTRSPIDETMAPPVIGSRLRRSRGNLVATIRCDRRAPKACAGRLAAQGARGGRALARARFRVPAGATRRVQLRARGTAFGALRTARLTTVNRGVSRRGNTTVIAQRRVR